MRFDPNARLTKEHFKELPPLCSDGAWGTELARHGALPGQVCDLLNIEAPDTVFQVAQGYVEAGAQIILTNTFNSNRIRLAKYGLAEKAAQLSQAGAAISKRAARGKAYVFASIGPCGKMVMMDEIAPEEVEEAAAEQAAALVAGGADAIVIETQTDLVEAEAMLRGCLRACSVPIGVSFTFDSGPDNDRTMMGVGVAEVYALAKANGASLVGANCGAGIETFAPLVRQFVQCGRELPIWVKGNAGKAELDDAGNTIFAATPETYAEAVRPLLAAGARFIGGCCGSTPAHIRAIAHALASAASAEI